MLRPLAAIAIVLLLGGTAAAETTAEEVRMTVGRTNRYGLVYAPAMARKSEAPVVFAFHGHGGTAEKAAAIFAYQKLWPEAITVYMQGLPIPSSTDPAGKKAGWQHDVGEVDDRDLKFFDQMFAYLKKNYRVDESRVYVTGHSNGGGFTYLLWAARGDVFAAVAPSSASSAIRYVKNLKPKPALHVAGAKDETVPYENQRKLMDAIRTLNGCDRHGKAWHNLGTIYPSASGTPFVEVIHPGGHSFLDGAPKLIVSFFREHPQR